METQNIEEQVSILQDGNVPTLLPQMGLARENMAVVQPVLLPTLPNHQATNLQADEEGNRPDNLNMNIDAVIDSSDGSNEPVADTPMSIEEEDLPFTEDRNTNLIDIKALTNVAGSN